MSGLLRKTLLALSVVAVCSALLRYQQIQGQGQSSLARGQIVNWYYSNPEPFRSRLWFTLEFALEMHTIGERIAFDTDRRYWYPQDTHWSYYRVKDRIRRTYDSPAQYGHTIWMVGSSTVFDIDVPDEYTLASYLQRQVPPDWRVVNAGLIANVMAGESQRLRELDIQPLDIVLWMGGAWDARMIYEKALQRNEYQCPKQLEAAEAQVAVNAQTIIDARAYVQDVRQATLIYILEPTIWAMDGTAADVAFNSDYVAYSGTCLPRVTLAYYDMLAYQALDWRHDLDFLRREGIHLYYDAVHRTDAGHDFLTWKLLQVLGWR